MLLGGFAGLAMKDGVDTSSDCFDAGDLGGIFDAVVALD